MKTTNKEIVAGRYSVEIYNAKFEYCNKKKCFLPCRIKDINYCYNFGSKQCQKQI